MKKRIILAVATLSTIPAIAMAVPAPKYFVCKYVGKPGVDERLQTGNNPISVSGNAITPPVTVGAYFNDAQGRSLVVAEDTGQDEPDCPVPVNPNPPTDEVTPPKTETPSTTTTPQTTTSTPAEVLPQIQGK